MAVFDPMRISGTSRIWPDDGAHGDRGDRGPQAEPEVHAHPAERDGAQADGAADEHHEERAGGRGALGLRDAVDAVALEPRRRRRRAAGHHLARRSLPLNAHGRVPRFPLRRSSDDRGASSVTVRCAPRPYRAHAESESAPSSNRRATATLRRNRRRHDRQPSCGVVARSGDSRRRGHPQVRRRSRRRCRRTASTARRCRSCGQRSARVVTAVDGDLADVVHAAAQVVARAEAEVLGVVAPGSNRSSGCAVRAGQVAVGRGEPHQHLVAGLHRDVADGERLAHEPAGLGERVADPDRLLDGRARSPRDRPCGPTARARRTEPDGERDRRGGGHGADRERVDDPPRLPLGDDALRDERRVPPRRRRRARGAPSAPGSARPSPRVESIGQCSKNSPWASWSSIA